MIILSQEIKNKFGCTTPYGNIKKDICTNSSIGKLIAETNGYKPACKYPCQYLGDFELSSKEVRPGLIRLWFKKYVRVFETKYTYSLVDLFAALGGYLGSFLGVSLFHLRDGLAYLIRKVTLI